MKRKSKEAMGKGKKAEQSSRKDKCGCKKVGDCKKAQATLFAIIGLILVAGALTVAILTRENVPGEMEEKIAEMPVAFQPIRGYVDNCIIKMAAEGIKKLGMQGGYIDPIKSGLKQGASSTESDFVEYPPGSKVYVPYWWYLKSENECAGECEFGTKRPSLYREGGEPSIEGQMDDYVNENLKTCLQDFGALTEMGFKINEAGEPKTTTSVTANEITFKVEYPLEIVKEGTTTISEFFVSLPINMMRIYEQATSLANLQMEQQYLEKVVMKLLVAFGDIDEQMLPPTSGMTFEFGSTMHWSRSRTRELVKQMLGIYIQGLQVYNTLNYEPVTIIGQPRREAWYNSGMLVPATPDAEKIKVDYNYLDWWDIYFNINCNGEICRPESISTELLPIVGIQRYNFLYDISFPTLVEITDPDALNFEGYKFQLLLEGNLRNNRPMTTEFAQLEGISIRESSMLCDPNKRNSGNVTVIVKDDMGGAVEGAKVVYTCGKESCMIGQTNYTGGMTERFPICLGGTMELMEPEHLKKTLFLTTRIDEPVIVEAVLPKRQEVGYEVKKFSLVKKNGFWEIMADAQELGSKEEATIILTRIGAENDDDYGITGDYKKGDSNKIGIYQGKYEVNVQLMSGEPFKISKEICTKPNIIMGCDETQKIEIDFNKNSLKDNQRFKEAARNATFSESQNIIVGGALLNHTFTADELSREKITFYALHPNIVGLPEDEFELSDINLLSQMDTYSQIYLSAVQPR